MGLVELHAHPARHLEVYHETESGVNCLTVKNHAAGFQLGDRVLDIVTVEGDVVGAGGRAVLAVRIDGVYPHVRLRQVRR